VPLHPELVALLTDHLARYRTGPGGRIFTGPRGGIFNDRAYLRIFHQARDAAFGPAEAASLLARRPTTRVMRLYPHGSTRAFRHRRSPNGPDIASASCSASTPGASPVRTRTPSAASRPPPCQPRTTPDDALVVFFGETSARIRHGQPYMAALSRVQPHKRRTARNRVCAGQGLFRVVVAGIGFEPT